MQMVVRTLTRKEIELTCMCASVPDIYHMIEDNVLIY